VLELDAFSVQFIYRLVNVFNGEIEDCVGRGNVVAFGVNEDGVASGNRQSQATWVLANLQPERTAVKLLCRSQIVDRETAERLDVFEYDWRLLPTCALHSSQLRLLNPCIAVIGYNDDRDVAAAVVRPERLDQ
jgi:hypothetical protein